MRRFLKWTGVVLASPILLFLFLSFIIYLPPVQDFAVRKATAYASEATGLDISVGRLRLRFPLDLDLQDFAVRDSVGDTIAVGRSLVARLGLSEVMHRRIGIDGIELTDITADTRELIASVRVAGRLASLSLRDDVDLGAHHVAIDDITLRRADILIVVRDTVTPTDTTKTIIPWTIDVRRAEVAGSHVSLRLEADSLSVGAAIDQLVAEGADIDLAGQLYNVRTCEGRLSSIGAASQDNALLRLPDINLKADSIGFDGDAMHVDVRRLGLRTASSRINGSLALDLNAFTPAHHGRLEADLDARLGRDDVALALMQTDSLAFAPLVGEWPDVPVRISLNADGNMDTLRLSELNASLPGTLDLEVRGVACNLLDSTALSADFGINARSGDVAWLMRYAGADPRRLHLPPLTLTADGQLRAHDLGLSARLAEGGGTVELRAQASMPGWHIETVSYNAKADVRRLNLRHFMPRDSIGLVSATVSLNGRGIDLYSRSTRLDAHAQVHQLVYGQRFDLDGIAVRASVSDGQGRAVLTSDNSLLSCRADIAAMLERQLSGLTFGLDLTRADLHALGLTAEPLSVAACFHIDGTIDDITLITADTLFRPEDITLRALLRPDTVHAFVGSGDLYVTIDTDKGYDRLLRQSSRFTAELQRQWQARRFNIDSIRHELPMAQIHALVGSANPAHDILKTNGIDFEMANIDFMLSPVEGLNCGGQVYGMTAGGVQLDTVSLYAFSDTTGLSLEARVHNGRRNPQFRFDARLSAQLTDTGSVARLKYIDERGNTGIDVALRAAIEDESLLVCMDPLNPVIAYRSYHVNADNYFRLLRRNRIETDIKLVSDDGTGLNLYSTPNADALQDLTLGLHHVNIGRLISVVPYAPRLTGMLDGDVHLLQHDSDLTISASITANDLTYESASLGQVGLQAVYLPNSDGSHYIDGSLLHSGMPVATIGGTLGRAGTAGAMSLDMDLGLERFPISLANGFIPTGDAAGQTPMAQLSGFLMGDVHLGGTTARPDVAGTVHTSDVAIRSSLYSIDMRLADSDLTMAGSSLALNSLRLYASGVNPLVVAGTVDFADLDRIRLDMTVSASDFELINAGKTTAAVAYGRVYVDLYAMLRGTLDDISLLGNLKVLSNTDVTYVITDSPLSADDQLAGLVEFVDFSDTARVEATAPVPRPQHINVFMNVQIQDAAHVHCILSADGNNYVDIEGGGDLQLNGRYTVNSGTLKYTMMVIPLKEFAIKSGSYVEFRGPIANPYLNLSATERLRTTLTEGGQPRSVEFDVGLTITQTLSNMGLEFTIDAPEDLTVQNELASMSTEQRGRVAVTMLATGMYITDTSTATGGGFSTQNALNAFLQSQISNIAGRALKSVDLSMDVEQGTSSAGTTTTDYSFRFAKRFWGNRISVIVGGRVSTGEDATNTGQSLIDNVSIEYRLDKSATRYVNVFYDKNNESVLDGEVTEMGAGLVLRRKTNRLGELFLFKKQTE